MINKLECVNRDEFYQKLSTKILESGSFSFQFVGKNGTGKEYVINKLEENLKRKCELYRIVSDTLIKNNKTIATHKINVSLSLNNFIGMSLSFTKNEQRKINYIISNLKSISLKKIILISAIGYESLPSESREFIDILLSNKTFIEEKIKKQITVILTSTDDFFLGKYNVQNVKFRDYDKEDMYHFLVDICKYDPEQITSSKLKQIIKLCGTNLDLVKSYSNFILNKLQTNNCLENIIDTKLNYYIQSGNKYNLSKDDLKTIILTSSMSIYMLTPTLISYINNIDEKNVQKGFVCAVNEKFIEEDFCIDVQSSMNFSFISKKEKDYLYTQAEKTYINKKADYYNYISRVAEAEYFERAQYLFCNYNSINKNVFAMIMLAISKSFLLSDGLEREKIILFFNNNNSNEKLKILFENINSAYDAFYREEYKTTIAILDKIDYSQISTVLSAELRRLQFRSSYMGKNIKKEKINIIVNELKAYLKKSIYLEDNFRLEKHEEKLLSLRIIYDLAPYILDTLNDKQTFCELYDRSLILVKYIDEHFIKKGFAEYVINIFNRKAFLFVAPSQAVVYYEQAVAYFRENKIWDEYIISLASKAGNEIAIHEYSRAIKSCKLALQFIEEKQLEIPQVEKIYNNLYIAEYLYIESTEKLEEGELKENALNTSQKLEHLLTTVPCGTNHVILMNIASMYLYAGDETKYNETKHRLEKSLGCKNVSEITDVNINDFYRYHFAWYEFYLNLQHHNWRKCSQIIDLLDSFYPSIFHNNEKMNLRVSAARYLIKFRIIPDFRKYGINMLQYSPQDKNLYSSRGLPVSDLQFTSWE